jgi:Na+-transporting NADH:ubiquinone oxidoreductase subunit E
MAGLLTILIAAILTHNIALTYLLGMCPFISLSRSLKTALGMGMAVIFVITLTAVIAASVQLVEMIMERFFPALQAAFGIFLPLITVNCTVLAVSLFMVLRDYSYIETVFFAFGSAVGWTLAITIVAAMNEKLKLIGDIPKGLRGPGIIMIIAGIIALAFLGFGGMVSIQ